MKSTGTVIALFGALWSGVPDALDWIDILSNAHASMTSSTKVTTSLFNDALGDARALPDTKDNR